MSNLGDLSGKTALVTGASKGIGASIALSLAEAGASVVVNYASDKNGADRVVRDIKAKGGKAVAVQGDVSRAADVQRVFEEANKAFGSLDILVNNAGVFAFAPIEEFTEREFQRQYGINVLGPLLTTREAVKHFNPRGGSVINISSVASQKGLPGSSVYAGTKGALDSLSKALANELAPRKIRVNVIAPGGVETEGTHALGVIGSDFEKRIIDETPLGRLGQPQDIAGVAVFLASDQSAWLTGERISASGGAR